VVGLFLRSLANGSMPASFVKRLKMAGSWRRLNAGGWQNAPKTWGKRRSRSNQI
jgi:hypothetical protein